MNCPDKFTLAPLSFVASGFCNPYATAANREFRRVNNFPTQLVLALDELSKLASEFEDDGVSETRRVLLCVFVRLPESKGVILGIKTNSEPSVSWHSRLGNHYLSAELSDFGGVFV